MLNFINFYKKIEKNNYNNKNKYIKKENNIIKI